ncbi:MAG: acetoacetate decarboxylase family protein [Bifidobacteriaceae bacterium]|nr:acetoacetate decarboxylase family protein [Bifidobacteriaceae bacterium]
MEVTDQFDGSLLDNADKFNDPFFERFTLQRRRVRLTPEIEKEYPFPTFYSDVTCAQAIFLCSYQAARAMMPHPLIGPVRARGRWAVLAVSCYEYKNVMGIPPYNEVALTLAVEVDKPNSPVLLPLMLNNYSGYYVFSMPVTSRENCLRGNNIWGLPKVTQRIDIDTAGPEARIACFDGGAEYFSLRVPKAGKPTPMDETTYLYSKLDSRILKSRTCFKSVFAITKNNSVLLNPGKAPDREYIKIADSPAAAALNALAIQPSPLQLRYTEHMVACFDYYEPDYDIDGKKTTGQE